MFANTELVMKEVAKNIIAKDVNCCSLYPGLVGQGSAFLN